MKSPETPIRYRWLIVGVLIAVTALGVAVWQGAIGQDRASVADSAAVAQAKSLSRAFRAAADQVKPTVVKIKTLIKPRVLEGESNLRENPFKGTPFEDLFDEDDLRGFRFQPRIPQRRGVGSGVIIDPSGVILTNNHVVEGADEVLVELPDGRQLKATDIKTDEQTDLAVLRIKADERLPAARLGDSDKMEIGDWVIAVGNPFELDGTVSAGIISGKGRALRAGKRANFLQTDAAINPGNSGGPLVNLDGEVVGINTAIASSTGWYQGVGFAIPSNLAKWVTDQLIKRGSVQRAYLGVGIEQISRQLARKLGVERDRGVLVSQVFPDSPAAAAGFQEGDVILAFAGRPVSNPRELQELVERSPSGSRQRVEITRDGKARTLHVVVKPLPDEFSISSAPAPERRRGGESSGFRSEELSLQVGDLTDGLAERLGYKGVSGVLVTDVDVGGIAEAAGIREGMLIRRVEKKSVRSVAEFKAALKGKSLRDGILLLLRTRSGEQFYVVLEST